MIEPGQPTAEANDAPSLGPSPASGGEGDVARTAGRGGLAVTGAKIWFILIGFLQQTVLSHLLGLDGYGAFSVALTNANVPNNVVVTASIQGVSRGVAESPFGTELAVEQRLLRLHRIIGPMVAVVFLLLAPVITSFEHAPHLLPAMRIFSLVLLAYSLYAPVIGALNGRHRFVAQAGLDVAAATLRTVGLLGAAAIASTMDFHAPHEAPALCAAGLALTAAVMLPIAVAVLRRARASSPRRENAAPAPSSATEVVATKTVRSIGLTYGVYLPLLARLAIVQGLLQLLMQADFLLLRRFAHEAGERSGLAGEMLRTEVDRLMGSYKAAQLFAFLPYQLVVAVTFVLFPMLARAHAERDREALATYVRTGVRIAMVVAATISATIAAVAPELLRFAFSPVAAEQAGTALRVLALGQGAFALLGVESTVLSSLSREWWSLYLTAAAVVTVAFACVLFVPGAPFGAGLLVRTACAAAGGLVVAAGVGAILVYRTAGSFARIATLVRVPLAMAVAVAIGTHLPWLGRPIVLVELAAMATCVVFMLVVTGELKRDDLAMIKRTIGRRR